MAGYDGDELLDDVEVLDFLDVGACPKPAPFADARRGHVGTFVAGMPLVCGGLGPEGDTASCYEYDSSSESWNELASTMTIPRRNPGAVMMDDTHWWITGGSYFGDFQDNSEIYDSESGTFSAYVDLPLAIGYHTMAKVNDSLFYMAAGARTDFASFLYDTTSETWTELPGSNVEHNEGFAGVLNLPDGAQKLVLAGGNRAGSSTEIYSFETNSWSNGPDFPLADCFSGQTIAYQDSFLAVGGTIGFSDYNSAVFYLDPVTMEWVEMDGALITARRWFSGFLVDDDYITCGELE